ncbi:MAG TPA: hypothetical protein VM575_14270 [Nocardioides sp.]|nr:hypothetical protein [Nocardioides sp.]
MDAAGQDDVGSLPPHAQLVAQAVAGRAVELRLTRAESYSDGWVVHLGNATPTAHLTWTAIAQASLVGVGSLDPDVTRRLSGAGRERQLTYVALELRRAARELAHVLPPAYLLVLDADGDDSAARPGSAAESADLALAGRSILLPPSWAGILRPRAVLRAGGGVTAPTHGPDSISRLEMAAGLSAPDEGNDQTEEGERSRFLERLAGPFSGPLGTAFQRMLGASRAEGEGVTGAGVTGARRLADRPKGARLLTPRAAALSGAPHDTALGARYPEWDQGRGRYRRGWCTVTTLDPAPPEHGSLPWRDDSAARLLARRLVRVTPARTRARREATGADLDLTAIVEHRTALAAGHATPPLLFQGVRSTAGDLAVLVLLDATESATETTGSGPGRSLYSAHRALAGTIAQALTALDVPVACYAFRSRGRHDVRLLRSKAFTDRWDSSARLRLHAVEPGGYTRLGAVLRHGTRLMRFDESTKRRLVVVVGDGVPYDDGYEGGYALADSRRALSEARATGLSLLGLAAQSSPALARLWGDDHCVASTPASLATSLPAAMKRVFTTAPGGPREPLPRRSA